ncbi:hypothetical protein GCM10017744_027610 [Streptomyces antimycoticus]|uniref:Uncharacterized protein n=1 Tax=Streptomyces antimycoticus TaxID=68175 RepID=A0A4D4KL41_9ACTN|nr:hypothetical protein [Streptomyces antimycoticus]GDY46593.1 hypothetical protein SANT12839_074750 [Streptomyces antimycoticus]
MGEGAAHRLREVAGEEGGVGDDVRQLLRQPQGDGVAAGAEVVEGRGQCLVEVDGAEVEVQGSGVQSAQVVQVGEELGDAAH